MEDLIKRLEAAIASSRDLDAEIYVSIYRSAYPDETLDQRKTYARSHCPAYTLSIDDALTLLPDGYVWECGYSRHVPHNARVASMAGAHGGWVAEHDHSRAITLCIAILKARQASLTKGER